MTYSVFGEMLNLTQLQLQAISVPAVLGPLIGLEYNGEAVCVTCHDVLERTMPDWRKSVYISPDPSIAAQQIEVFYSVADMMMAV